MKPEFKRIVDLTEKLNKKLERYQIVHKMQQIAKINRKNSSQTNSSKEYANHKI